MFKSAFSIEMFLFSVLLVLTVANLCSAGDALIGQKSIVVATVKFSIIFSQLAGTMAVSPMSWLYYVYTNSLVPRRDSELEQAKNRRGGTVGLFAFPRVGRSDPSLSNWDFNPNSYEQYDDEFPKMELKRSGLVAFPRVGRSDNQLRRWSKMAALQQNVDKRTGVSANSGLWFGPRLGRIQKRSTDNHYPPEDDKIPYTPRLGRDTEEDFHNMEYDVILTKLIDLESSN